MSTVVVVRKGSAAVIGADTLAKFGSMNERPEYVVNHSKLVRAGDGWLGIVGHASLPLVLEHYLGRLKRPPKLHTVQQVFAFSLELHDALKEDYHLLTGEEDEDGAPFESSQLDCLVATPGGLFGLYRMRSVHQYTRFYAIGSGGDYAMGAMRAVYDTLEDPADIARAGLEAAADFDDSTGGPFELQRFEVR
ncbi:MAG: ATP-dependent HslUV protease subunit HslV [Myxococcota bacterium]|jgi:ATP-dependent HslUV protease subunit HslV